MARRKIKIGATQIEPTDEEDAEHDLGLNKSFMSGQEQELRHRIANAWAAFHNHKHELCNQYYAIKDRIRLFEATVTQTALYGSAAWALTKDMRRRLYVERRKMLRYEFRLFRKKQEMAIYKRHGKIIYKDQRTKSTTFLVHLE